MCLSSNWLTQLEFQFVRLTLCSWGIQEKTCYSVTPSLWCEREEWVWFDGFGSWIETMRPCNSDLSPAGMIVQTMVFFLCLLVAVFLIIIPILHRQNLILFQILWRMWWVSITHCSRNSSPINNHRSTDRGDDIFESTKQYWRFRI